MTEDGDFAATMAYCGPRGIPYLDFLDWDPISRAAAVAWSAREADRCGRCGLPHSEWDRTDDGKLLPGSRQHLERGEDFCPGCELLDVEERAAAEDHDRRRPPGRRRRWFLRDPHRHR